MPSHAGISATNQAFMEAFGRGDAAGVANLYTKTGCVLPPNFEVIGGMEAIRGFWQGAMDMGIKKAKLETVDLEVYQGAAWERGNYTLTGAKGEVMDRGKYIVVWKEEGGKWKLHLDIWNSSLPAPSK
jgi:ketosteroid isomerase-like protein